MVKRVKATYFVSIIALCIMIAVIFSFVGYKTAQHKNEDRRTFYATITDITDHFITVSGMDENDIYFRGSFTFTVKKGVRIVRLGTDISFDALDVGDHVAITFSGLVLETNPAELTNVIEVLILDNEA